MFLKILSMLILIFVTGGACLSFADTIELDNGRHVEGRLYVIKDGYHYIRIHKALVDRVRYAARPAKPDTLMLKSGLALQGKITAYIDDEYYIRIPSQQVKEVTAEQQSAAARSESVYSSISAITKFKEGLILRIHGSNTIGASLAPAFAKAYLIKAGAANLQEVAEKDEEVTVQGILPGNSKASVIEIHSHGSATAFIGLENKKCDIGASSRKISGPESAKLEFLGDMTSDKNEHVIGLDGIAVIVNKSNPVFKLGKDDIRKIFSGEITDWSQLGGKRGPVNVYARDDKSGTWDTFKSIVLGKSKLVPSAKRYEDSTMLSNDVSKDINGIGFIGLPYVLNAKAIAVSDGAEPVAPDRFSIATEDYPLSRRLFFYTPGESGNTYVDSFLEFALSEEGQGIVDRIGFVDLNVKLAQPKSAGDFSEQYLKLTRGADRLSVNFRFRKNSFELDTKGTRDIQRVAAILKSSKNNGRRIMLFGFTDAVGQAEENRRLSERRALAVQKVLLGRGINIKTSDVVGFGRLNPVASNDAEDGRERNRRVEIWIK